MANQRFADAGAGVKYGPGSTASGSDHRIIPEDEGGVRDEHGRYENIQRFLGKSQKNTHVLLVRLPEAKHFTGPGGPEDKLKMESENRSGDQDAPTLQDFKRRGI